MQRIYWPSRLIFIFAAVGSAAVEGFATHCINASRAPGTCARCGYGTAAAKHEAGRASGIAVSVAVGCHSTPVFAQHALCVGYDNRVGGVLRMGCSARLVWA